MSNHRRVAITGIGIVSPLGHDAESNWQALLAGKSGITHIKQFDASTFPCTIAAEVKNFQAEKYVEDKKLLKYALPFTGFALAAANEALSDASIRPTQATSERWGLVTGSGMMNADFDYWCRFSDRFASEGEVDTDKLAREANDFFKPTDFGRTQANAVLGLIAKQHNIRGYTNSVHTACASGGQGLGLAMQALRRGDADYILAGGFDSMINPIGLASFCLLGAVSTYNETPETASRPFDLTRNGFVLGEGAAFLVLENWEKAKQRGARIYAELAGEGNSLSSYRITDSHPSGDGAIQALQGALKDSGESIDRVDYINAHGTATKMNDLTETNAIKAVFADRAKQIPISSIKGQTGHLIAGAGAIEGAFTALSIYHSKIPMTANFNKRDPECDLDYVSEGPRDKEIRFAISNSFGFGGSNSCVAFRNAEL